MDDSVIKECPLTVCRPAFESGLICFGKSWIRLSGCFAKDHHVESKD